MQKTVFVTGASSGFGEAIARRYVAEGHRVIAAARRLERLDALADELGRDKVLPLELDVRDRAAVEALPASLPEAWREVDVLVNNAGLALGLKPAQEVSLDAWETMVDTNIKGLMYVTRAFLPGMVQRRRGHVINLGSVAGTYPYPGGNVYGGTKAFVHQFSLNLRNDINGSGVRVTVVEPGMCETEFSQVRFGGDKAKAAAVYADMKPLSADDIAEMVYWASALPPHVNINVIETMPVQQAWSAFAVARNGRDAV